MSPHPSKRSWIAFRVAATGEVQPHPGVIYAETLGDAARVACELFGARTETEKRMIFVRLASPG
jgi:hypothetical protein